MSICQQTRYIGIVQSLFILFYDRRNECNLGNGNVTVPKLIKREIQLI